MIFLQPLFVPFALALIALAAVRPAGIGGARAMLAVNLAFMLLFLGPVQTAVLIGFALAGWLLVRFAAARLAIAVLLCVALFVVLKKYSFLPELLRPDSLPVAVGLSYVLFRILHLAIDHGQGSGPALRADEHLAYTLNAFALLSGPFQRYEEYRAAADAAQKVDPLPALARLGNGLLKVVLVAPVFKAAHAMVVPDFAGAGSGLAVTALVAASLAWLVFMYFNFSGYTDIVIGWARLCRLDLPENFDRPWLATGFLDFWARWHMSMTSWFRTYAFSQFLVMLGRRFPERRWAPWLSAVAFFATFLLVGAWHGPTPAFIGCGVLLGLGATVNQLFREWVRGRVRKGRAPKAPPGLARLGAGFTFCYIALAVAPFWLDGPGCVQALRWLASGQALAIVAVATLIVGAASAALAWLGASTRPASAWIGARLATPAGIAVRLVAVVLLAIVAADSLPDFVYKGI